MTLSVTSCSSKPVTVNKTVCAGSHIALLTDEILCQGDYCMSSESLKQVLKSNEAYEACNDKETR